MFGWFIDHGWTPPAELQQRIEEARAELAKEYMSKEECGECLAQWVSALKKYNLTVDSPESLATSVDILIEEAKKRALKEAGEWLLDEYEATPQDKRIALFETVIEKLIAGQALKEGE